MGNAERLKPRSAFLDARRRVRIYFETGSVAKFAQANLVFNRLGLALSGTTSSRVNGIEDYHGGAQQLIEQKLRDVRFGHKTVYFVEDTYIRIEALSEATEAEQPTTEWAKATRPGLQTKEWFQGTSFEQLDSLLVKNQGDRRATVYSTIGLHIPGVATAQVFSGYSTGLIAEHPGTGLEANESYPWLCPNSFNAWFIPEGEDAPLSDLDLERALDVDFRVSALLALADRVEEYVAILNLPPVSVEVVPHTRQDSRHPQLFATRRPPIAIVGLTCAGKTTTGQLLDKYGYTHIEASSVLQILQGNNLPPNSRPGYFQAMMTLNSYGWSIVARRAVDLYEHAVEAGICITGLRTIEEMHFLTERFPDLLIVLLEASQQTRFDRYERRGRAGDDPSFSRFRQREDEHASFGLVDVAEHCATVRISNESTMSELEAYARLLEQNGPAISGPGVSRRNVGVEVALRSQLYRCALVLSEANAPLSPAEIEIRQRDQDEARVVKRNAVRKALTEYPVLVRRARATNGATYYELTDHGRAYTALIDTLRSARHYTDSDPDDDSQAEAWSHIHSK